MKMEIVADLLNELAAANKALDFGGGVFINEMPATAKHGVLLMDTYAGTPIDPYIPKLRFAGLRLIVRSPSYVRGYRAANAICDELSAFRGMSVSGPLLAGLLGKGVSVELRQVFVMNEPKPYRSSEGGYVEFELEIELTYVAP